LPSEDGYALIRRVRALPATARLPALALTAYASNADHRRALEAGFQRHVSKPVEPGELAAALLGIIAESRARAGGAGASAGPGAPPPMTLAALSHG